MPGNRRNSLIALKEKLISRVLRCDDAQGGGDSPRLRNDEIRGPPLSAPPTASKTFAFYDKVAVCLLDLSKCQDETLTVETCDFLKRFYCEKSKRKDCWEYSVGGHCRSKSFSYGQAIRRNSNPCANSEIKTITSRVAADSMKGNYLLPLVLDNSNTFQNKYRAVNDANEFHSNSLGVNNSNEFQNGSRAQENISGAIAKTKLLTGPLTNNSENQGGRYNLLENVGYSNLTPVSVHNTSDISMLSFSSPGMEPYSVMITPRTPVRTPETPVISLDNPLRIIESPGPICRICHDGSGTLISPCLCSGTVGLIHKSCLETWLTQTRGNSCEICKYTYNVVCRTLPMSRVFCDAKHRAFRHSVLTDLLCFLFLTPLSVSAVCMCLLAATHVFQKLNNTTEDEHIDIYSEVPRKRMTTNATLQWEAGWLLLLGAGLLMVYLCWFSLALSSHLKSWQKWRSVNQRVKLLDLRRPSRESVTTRNNNHHPFRPIHLTLDDGERPQQYNTDGDISPVRLTPTENNLNNNLNINECGYVFNHLNASNLPTPEAAACVDYGRVFQRGAISPFNSDQEGISNLRNAFNYNEGYIESRDDLESPRGVSVLEQQELVNQRNLIDRTEGAYSDCDRSLNFDTIATNFDSATSIQRRFINHADFSCGSGGISSPTNLQIIASNQGDIIYDNLCLGQNGQIYNNGNSFVPNETKSVNYLNNDGGSSPFLARIHKTSTSLRSANHCTMTSPYRQTSPEKYGNNISSGKLPTQETFENRGTVCDNFGNCGTTQCVSHIHEEISTNARNVDHYNHFSCLQARSDNYGKSGTDCIPSLHGLFQHNEDHVTCSNSSDTREMSHDPQNIPDCFSSFSIGQRSSQQPGNVDNYFCRQPPDTRGQSNNSGCTRKFTNLPRGTLPGNQRTNGVTNNDRLVNFAQQNLPEYPRADHVGNVIEMFSMGHSLPWYCYTDPQQPFHLQNYMMSVL